ncbi:DegT/DnrJ/EryC1/StrS family aminotransferase [Chitinibacter bivalviorum]|uniref:DegT/DnrJ/EryC1/StrS family aminotransferase n=1 Tax=Chitinibacter bivalviorum TaxID=2739434 RepID=A0A7H9BFB1_9NEIS|nr:DegT/DnrJ/EryC1/StrS family aminotransferase [Chitinibacter bivalviorum]QLG87393.1 DegT/DnrJ/EryC1/StrS family aminotransferase [Chitinibacter bivalviorum]
MIPVFKPLIEAEEINASKESLEMGWLGMGSYVSQFEEAVAKEIGGDRYVAAVSTATAGLHLALLLAEVGAGDEVIVASFNCSADFQVVSWVGAELVFCDCIDDGLGIDLDKAQLLVTEKTKAVIVMDYACGVMDHEKVRIFAEKNQVRIIHDASHSFGSSYQGKKIGSFSDITVFSFDPVKTVTCLDGGVVVVKSEAELKRLHELRLLGMQQPSTVMYKNQRAWTFDVASVGFRYHMLNMHAAIGMAQINKLDVIRDTRRLGCLEYSKQLANFDAVKIPKGDFYGMNPFIYYIRVDSQYRDNLREYLKEQGVDTGIHWLPGHTFTLWKQCKAGDLTVTSLLAKELITLPLHSKMAINDIKFICEKIRAFFGDKND